MIVLDSVAAGYGDKEIIKDFSIKIRRGEFVSIVGPNGSGKSTLLKTIIGLITARMGTIEFKDKPIGKPADNIRNGLHYLPQGEVIFPDLTVLENISLSWNTVSASRISYVLELIPTLRTILKEKGYNLSGGEKQLTGLARILTLDPEVILLDEPSIGLSPLYADIIMRHIEMINRELNITVLLVEQNVKEALKITKRVVGIKLGKRFFDIEICEHHSLHELLNDLFLS